jgi:hypothetical protein
MTCSGPELLDGHLATALLQTPADAGQAAHPPPTNDNDLVSLSLLSEKVPVRVAYALLVEDAERFSGLWRRAMSGHGYTRPCGNRRR